MTSKVTRMAVAFGCLALAGPGEAAERIVMQVEWGFGRAGAELYWDGEVLVSGGRLVSMHPVSFEGDRHDRMTPPKFRSYTVSGGTDGMELIVEGDDGTRVRIEGRQGSFQWRVGELRSKGELSFSGRAGGRLVVRLELSLGGQPRLLSDKDSQDCAPAVCRLADGRQLVLWRAFLGLPGKRPGSGGDQIRGCVLDRQGQPGRLFDLLERPGDVERMAVAAAGPGGCMVVWAEQRGGDWELFCRRLSLAGDGLKRGQQARLTTEPGVDRSPALAVASDGSLLLVWQAWRQGRSRILARRYWHQLWQQPQVVDAGQGDAWDPAVAASAHGAVAVAWSCWRNGSYDVCLRSRRGGKWGPVHVVAGSGRFEAHPSLAYDRTGQLWIAYEEGRAGWGLDSHTAGLRAERNIRLRLYRGGRLELPRGVAALRLPASFRNRNELPHLATAANGTRWLFFRRLGRGGVWQIYGTSLGPQGWSAPARLSQSAGGQDVRMGVVSGPAGRLRLVWPSDHRVNQVGRDSFVYTTMVAAAEPLKDPVQAAPAPVAAAAKPGQPSPPPRPALQTAGASMQLYFGDLHRHTELSVCRTGGDGSLQDAYRYAIDAAGLDFLCITDHVQHVKVLNDYDFWRSGKTADLNRVAGLHQPFYGYERSQRFPYGHRNIISLRRDVKRVPRTADNRPWSANAGYEGEQRIAPPELWARLVGQSSITIPHTTASPVMGTDFGHRPAKMEPVVEIYQGCRFTYEYPGAPDPRAKRDGSRYGGATQPAGFIWKALAKGYRYGFIASSDHSATHNSYTCVWAERFSNEAILDALLKRQCYAATDRIQCRMQMGGHLMGAEFQTAELPPLEVSMVGTADIERVDIIKDNRIVYTQQPSRPSRRISVRFQDTQVADGDHYYYARLVQTDRNMAWISPIWVTVKGAGGGR